MAAAATASTFLCESSDNVQAPTISSSVPSVSECSHRGGFTGMFKVPSLVFDIELEDNGIGGHWQEEDWEEDEVLTEIQRFVQPSTAAEARLLSDVRVACPHAKDGQDTARLVSILSALGYKCSLRTALGGGDGADCLRNLRHAFIVCDIPAANGHTSRRYIIDPLFKEQFIIAKTTARYAAVLAAIPQVFVGPEEHLLLLVNFLCSEMSAAFRQLGSVLPPWRQASSMLSKWKPRKSVDLDSLAGGAHPTARRCGAAGGGTLGSGGIAAAALPVGESGNGSCMGRPDWHCLVTCRPPGLQQPADHPQGLVQQPALLHHWQEAARAQQQQQEQHQPQALRTSANSGRPSYEPQRVVFGGNFVPVAPSPALAS